jgi:outer membrane protein TolC
MSSKLIAKFEAAHERVRQAKIRTAEAATRLKTAQGDEAQAEAELAVAREALEAALGRKTSKEDESPAKPAPSRILAPHVLALLLALPDTGDLGIPELEDALKLKDSALRSRIQKAKALGLVESISWGRYCLTPTGRAAKRPRLVGKSGNRAG